MAFDIWFYLTWLNSLIKVLEQFILSKSELIFTLLFNESWKTVFLPWIFSMVIKLSAGEIWTQFGRNKDRVFWYIGSQPSITWKAMVVGTYQAFSWCEENIIYNIIIIAIIIDQKSSKLVQGSKTTRRWFWWKPAAAESCCFIFQIASVKGRCRLHWKKQLDIGGDWTQVYFRSTAALYFYRRAQYMFPAMLANKSPHKRLYFFHSMNFHT